MRSSSRTRRSVVLSATAAASLALASFATSSSARGAADTWNNNSGTANWSTNGNWADGTEPLQDDVVTLPLGHPGGASTITLGADEVAKSVTFNDDYLLNGATLLLGAGGEINVAAGRNATINANIVSGGPAGSNGITKLGAGTLLLTAHTFTGQVEVTQGTLLAVSNNALGNAANALLLNGGMFQSNGSFTMNRPVIVGGGNGSINVDFNQTLTITGALSGIGNLTLLPTVNGPTGNRSMVLTAASTRTGNTTIEQGVARLDHGAALGTGNIEVKLNGSLQLNGVTVDQPLTFSGGQVRGSGGNATYAGTITVGNGSSVNLQSGNAPDTLTIGNGPNDFTGGGLNGSFGKTLVSGAGRVRLAQANNYQGDWQINGGILTVGDNNALGTGITPINMLSNSTVIELENGVTLDRAISMPNTTGLIGTGSSSFTGTITLAPDATVSIGGAATRISLGNAANDVTGGGATATIRKTGSGALEFTQRSNVQAGLAIWQGSVIVKPGAQIAGGNGAAGASSIRDLDLQPNTAAKLDLTSNSLVIKTGGVIGSASGGVYTGISRLLQRGSNAGGWNGPDGVVTSLPDAANGFTAIGVATAGQAGYAGKTFQGVSCDADDVILMYTYAGDANLDGFVSGDDYSAIDFSILVPGTSGWYNGDFNYDGSVTGDDYSAIDFGILAQGAPILTASASPGGVTPVPEPVSLAIAGGFAAWVSLGRWRRAAISQA